MDFRLGFFQVAKIFRIAFQITVFYANCTNVFVNSLFVSQNRDFKPGGIVAEFDSNWHGELSGDEFESDLMAMVCGDITMELVDASSMAVLGLCTLSIRQILHIAPSNVNTVKSREPLDNPDAHTLANSVLDGKVDCSLNAFHDFKKKKFSKDEQTISRSEMQRALKQLGVQDVELKIIRTKLFGDARDVMTN